jgi:hypothetical protein
MAGGQRHRAVVTLDGYAALAASRQALEASVATSRSARRPADIPARTTWLHSRMAVKPALRVHLVGQLVLPHPAGSQTASGVPRPGLRRASLSTPLSGLPNKTPLGFRKTQLLECGSAQQKHESSRSLLDPGDHLRTNQSTSYRTTSSALNTPRWWKSSALKLT